MRQGWGLFDVVCAYSCDERGNAHNVYADLLSFGTQVVNPSQIRAQHLPQCLVYASDVILLAQQRKCYALTHARGRFPHLALRILRERELQR